MSNTSKDDEIRNIIDIVESAKMAGFNSKTLSYDGKDGGYSNQTKGYYDTKQSVEAIHLLIVEAKSKATEDLVVKMMMTETEGIFSGNDLFIKRAPLEQVWIDSVGYEKYSAIRDAATSSLNNKHELK